MNDFRELLTPCERQVYDLRCAGKMAKEIAYELGSSRRTVEVHVAHITEKASKQGLIWSRALIKKPE